MFCNSVSNISYRPTCCEVPTKFVDKHGSLFQETEKLVD